MKMKDTYYSLHVGQWLCACLILLCALTAACDDRPDNMTVLDEWPEMYPNYINASIPTDMTPLNFSLTANDVEQIDVRVVGSMGGQLHSSGKHIELDKKEWHSMLERNVGRELTFTVCAKKKGEWVRYRDFQVSVR